MGINFQEIGSQAKGNQHFQKGKAMATGQGFIRVEVAETIIERLLADGSLCAADIRCLDCRAKQCVWRMALKSCTKIACEEP